MTYFSRCLWSIVFFLAIGLGSAVAAPRDAVQRVSCALFGCPQITSMYILSNSSPGGTVIIFGKGFGLKQGQAHLKLQQVAQVLPLDVSLDIVSWGENAIVAIIPNDITGVTEQTGNYYVISAGGDTSNSLGAGFHPTPDFSTLPPDQVDVWCSTAATTNRCQGNGDIVDAICGSVGLFGTGGVLPTIDGGHGTGMWNFSGDTGSDTYFSNGILLNGWAIDSFPGLSVTKTDGDEWARNSGVMSGGPTLGMPLTVEWSTDRCGFIFYDGNVYIKGPIGVPCTSDPHSCGAN
jgi:hypothetical protein